MTTPEWLRPVSERFLGGEQGPAPLTVRLAGVLAALNAASSAGMVAIFAPAVPRMWAQPVVPLVLLLTEAALALAGAGLFVVFAASTFGIVRRGWYRPPRNAGVTLAGIAGFGICVAAEPSRIIGTGGPPERDWAAASAVLPWMLTAAALAVGLVLVLRSGSASSWLAARRYQTRTADRPE